MYILFYLYNLRDNISFLFYLCIFLRRHILISSIVVAFYNVVYL